MKENLFSIGEISKIKGITIKALRFYEEIGVVNPCYKDPSTNYRYYSLEQFIQFDIIKASRAMGISPKDIKVILEKRDTGILLEFIDREKKSASMKISELEKNISLLNMVQNNIQNSILAVSNEDIFFNEIPVRHIVTQNLEHISEEHIHLVYSNLLKLIDENMLNNTYESGILYTPNQQQEFHPTQVFNVVTFDEHSNTSMISTIPAGRFICINHNKHNATERVSMFNEYLKQNEFQPSLVLQVDLLDNVFDYENVQMQALI